ncbi:MAG: hypothetical protein PHC66_03280 [Candidatus Nanoarchaeia archaeon]|nr:hypothetical protein [Candidatus Nanoarchaeia archaeon]MDD5239857.1 hypothetical protein [Candidatus Nanoarchaeia archaeon]
MNALDVVVGAYLFSAMAYQTIKAYNTVIHAKQNRADGILKRDEKTKKLYVPLEELLPFPLDSKMEFFRF